MGTRCCRLGRRLFLYRYTPCSSPCSSSCGSSSLLTPTTDNQHLSHSLSLSYFLIISFLLFIHLVTFTISLSISSFLSCNTRPFH
jgi:hypothetical protein